MVESYRIRKAVKEKKEAIETARLLAEEEELANMNNPLAVSTLPQKTNEPKQNEINPQN